jgi:hypothetical protein
VERCPTMKATRSVSKVACLARDLGELPHVFDFGGCELQGNIVKLPGATWLQFIFFERAPICQYNLIFERL